MKTFGGIVLVVIAVFAIALGGLYAWATSDVAPAENVAELHIPQMPELSSKLQVAFGQNFIGSTSWLVSQSDEKDVGEIIKKIDSLKVQIFDYQGSVQQVSENFEKAFVKLNNNEWKKIISVSEDNEQVRIFANEGEQYIKGLLIFVVNGEDAVLVKVTGELSAEDVNKVLASRHGM